MIRDSAGGNYRGFNPRPREGAILRRSRLFYLEFGEVFFGVGVELRDAGFAAEFHFLSFVDDGDGIAHGAECVVGDDAFVTSVWLDAGGGHVVTSMRVSGSAGA